MWKKLSLAAAVLGLGIVSTPASALTVNDIMTAIGTDPFRWEDNDIERLNVDQNGNGLLDVGDTLQAIIEIEKIINEQSGTEYAMGNGSANSSLAGIAEIEVKAKVASDLPGLFNFIFGPVGAGTSIAKWYESAVDNINITNCGATVAACLATVTDGIEILDLGMAGTGAEFWTALGPENPDLRTVSTARDVGGFNFIVNTLSSSIDAFNPGNLWRGSGSLQGCTTGSGTLIGSCENEAGTENENLKFTSTSDFQLSRVPEPAPLSLLGLGLLALGFARRWRQAS